MRRELEGPPRRRARASSEAAELRAVLDTLRDGVQVFDADGNMVSRNPAAAEMYELDEETPTLEGIFSKWEVINEQGVPLTHDERPLVRAMRGEPSDLVVVGIRRVVDGSVRWLSVSTSIIREPGGAVSGYVSCTRDVTQRIETIRGLRILTEAAARLSGSLVPETVTRVLAECASDLCSTPGERPRRAVVMLVEDDHMVLTGLTDRTHEGGTTRVP